MFRPVLCLMMGGVSAHVQLVVNIVILTVLILRFPLCVLYVHFITSFTKQLQGSSTNL